MIIPFGFLKQPDTMLGNIIAEYKMQDNVLDTVGGFDGTPFDITFSVGGVGKTAVFNGSSSRIIVGNHDAFSFVGTPFSFTLLAEFASIPTTAYFLSNESGGSASDREYQFKYKSSEISFTKIAGGTQVMKIPFIPVIGTLYHIGITSNGGNDLTDIKFYIDGVFVSQSGSTGTNTGMLNTISGFGIGVNTRDNGDKFDGELDVVRVWNKELSQIEMTDISTDELAGIDINP